MHFSDGENFKRTTRKVIVRAETRELDTEASLSGSLEHGHLDLADKEDNQPTNERKRWQNQHLKSSLRILASTPDGTLWQAAEKARVRI